MPTLRLNDLTFEGAFRYRHPPTSVELANLGRVLICGREGSGKSSVPEVVTSILYNRTSPRMVGNKLSGSGIVNHNARGGYFGRLSFNNGAQDVVLLQAHEHNVYKAAYEITIDGQDETPTGKPAQKAEAAKLVPLSYAEWLGIGYLYQGGVHDLLAGKPNEKKAYITTAFGLTIYDDLMEAAKEREKLLKSRAASTLEIAQTIADLRKQREDYEAKMAVVGVEIGQLVEEVRTTRKAAKKATRRLVQLESAWEAQRRLSESKREARNALTTAGFDGSTPESEVRATVKKVRKALTAASESVAGIKAKAAQAAKAKAAATAAKERWREAKTDVESAEADLLALREPHDSLIHKAEGYGLALSAIAERLDEVLSSSAHRRRLKGINFRVKAAKTSAKPIDLLNAAEFHRQQIQHVESAGEKHKNCPVCTRPLSRSAVDSIVEDLKRAEAKTLEEAHASVVAEVRAAVDAGKAGEIIAVIEEAGLSKLPWLVKLLDDTGKAEAKVKSTRKALNSAEAAWKEAKATVTDDVGGASELSEAEAKVEKLTSRLRKLDAALAAVSAYEKAKAVVSGDVDSGIGQEDVDKAAKAAKTAERKHAEAVRAHGELSALATGMKAIDDQLAKLNERAEKEAKFALELKGIQSYTLPFLNTTRATKVRECVGVLEQVLPTYIDAMFGSRYKGAQITFEVDEAMKNIDILLRTNRREKPVSAVQASGGERRRFTWSLVAALRETAPKRSNVMFFDEPYHDMASEGKVRFTEYLLPLMLERCPDLESVIVVAHDREVLDGAADTFDDVWHVEYGRKTGSRITTDQRLSRISL